MVTRCIEKGECGRRIQNFLGANGCLDILPHLQINFIPVKLLKKGQGCVPIFPIFPCAGISGLNSRNSWKSAGVICILTLLR